MNELCVDSVLCVCSRQWIYDLMKRTLLRAEISQDNTCGKYTPGGVDKEWFCCKQELREEDWPGGPKHLLNKQTWAGDAVGRQGQGRQPQA